MPAATDTTDDAVAALPPPSDLLLSSLTAALSLEEGQAQGQEEGEKPAMPSDIFEAGAY